MLDVLKNIGRLLFYLIPPFCVVDVRGRYRSRFECGL